MASSSSTNKIVKGGYFASWADLTPSTIKTELFTHIYYAFLNPNKTTFEFNVATEARKLKEFNETLHKKKPSLKTLFSVGGYSEGNAMFSNMASKSSSREKFILSSIKLARDYGFDGIDLDWEYPGTPVDMENMGRLIDEWRVAVQKDATSKKQTPLLLTAAVYNTNNLNYIDNGPNRAFPSSKLSKNLDWINVMTYDYHGADWEPSKTGAHAALNDLNGNGFSTSKALKSWIDSGIPKSKLMMGLPLYGRTWRLKDRVNHGIGAPAAGRGPGTDAEMTYGEIVKYNKDNGAKVVYDPLTVSAYSVAGDSWVGYDDKETVKKKIQYAQGLKIGGYFFWALHGDYKWEISTTASAAWPA